MGQMQTDILHAQLPCVALAPSAPQLHPALGHEACSSLVAHPLFARWNEDLDGVLLSFRNERVLTQAATIHPYFPFVRLEVAAEVAVFRPRPGMRLGAWDSRNARRACKAVAGCSGAQSYIWVLQLYSCA